MLTLERFLDQRWQAGGFSTEDVLASFLPLLRQTIATHQAGQVAPLEGLDELHVAGVQIWYEQARSRPLRLNRSAVASLEQALHGVLDIVGQTERTFDVGGETREVRDLRLIEQDDQPLARPAYILGYRCWEHRLEHHDPLCDVFVLGLVLASLACGLNFNQPEDARRFVAHRENLFHLHRQLHPVLAQAIARMTELDRHRRPQDLPALLHSLQHYREQDVEFQLELNRIEGFGGQDQHTRQQLILGRLQQRLFEISRRNRLLEFRPTMQSVNLTEASVPLAFNVQSVRADQILTWSDEFAGRLLRGKPVSLNKYLNFQEALYLPSVLDRIRGDARRDAAEFGFAQLRLVACFLRWANLKESPAEIYDSPLVLLPVELAKTKGVRDTFTLRLLEPLAEINPVIRHQFQQLYGIELPETLDLSVTSLDAFYEYLRERLRTSDAAVRLERIDRPRIDLLHERARRRVDQYRRRARLAGRGVSQYLDLDYSYDAANYHPLGIKLFSTYVCPPTNHLRSFTEALPRPRRFAVP
ncbi:MAG: DUF4011 domain-containing protein, partial [Pirellulaceae bacterium]|nr:DUF4011 domain-containing protein [Pirellulaceae bacterium]